MPPARRAGPSPASGPACQSSPWTNPRPEREVLGPRPASLDRATAAPCSWKQRKRDLGRGLSCAELRAGISCGPITDRLDRLPHAALMAFPRKASRYRPAASLYPRGITRRAIRRCNRDRRSGSGAVRKPGRRQRHRRSHIVRQIRTLERLAVSKSGRNRRQAQFFAWSNSMSEK
jgi:hypothetical protein